jgi:hypothetical protein
VDVDFFFKQRAKFIRQYYTTAVSPFATIKQKIEAGEDPYAPPYSEDGEPPFLEEWIDADTGIQIVGRTCISMLSESLKVYFQTWEELFGVKCRERLPAVFKKRGFWSGYRDCFSQIAELDWSACPADLSVIEQVVEARNRSQHHDGDISTLRVRHARELLDKYPRPIFIHEHERNLEKEDRASFSWLGSELIINEETLDEALRHVEYLVNWLEPKLQERRWRRY